MASLRKLLDRKNPCLFKVRQNVAAYNLVIIWMPGKIHFIGDALSRYPVFAPEAEEQGKAELDAECVSFATDVRKEPSFRFIFECAKTDDYCQVVVAS